MIIGEYTQTPGKAIIHYGKQIHASKATIEGERFNLIIWYRAQRIFHEFSMLIPELQEHVCNFLDVEELCRLACCSKTMHALIISTPSLWDRLYNRKYLQKT